jgi:hypothetical protein
MNLALSTSSIFFAARVAHHWVVVVTGGHQPEAGVFGYGRHAWCCCAASSLIRCKSLAHRRLWRIGGCGGIVQGVMVNGVTFGHIEDVGDRVGT